MTATHLSGAADRCHAPDRRLVLGGAAAGAGVTGLVAIFARNGESDSTFKSVIWVWLILAVVGVASVLVGKYRQRGRVLTDRVADRPRAIYWSMLYACSALGVTSIATVVLATRRVTRVTR